MTLHLASTNPAPVTLGWRAALLALELADQAAAAAHREMLCAGPGELLKLVDRWREAEARVALAAARERSERMRVSGRRWLRAVEVTRG